MTVIPDLKTLYEIDDSLWLEETIELLKAKRFDALDLDNASLLEQIIRHCLLLQFWTEERAYNQDHWELEIVNFQIQLKRRLTTNLRNYLQNELTNIYEDAVFFVRKKTKNKVTFPNTCPYSLEELLDPNWLPPYE
ncbi:MAG: DUF29 domain-containing protein [Microcystis aeruginosa L211-11]|nr:DUF29 domain-containing protein [Microcystis aeruginosa L211-11]